jgi:glycosyltransferase involved in cell wall biosynthesis
VIVYVYPADEFGCGKYRLIWVSQALQKQGHDIRVVLPSMRTGIGGDIDRRTGRLTDVIIPPDADVIVMQRVSLRHLSDGIAKMRDKGVAVVVDMDDDLTKIDPNNPAFRAMHAKTGDPRHNWGNAHRACLDATLVTVSTPALLKVYAPHGRGIVLENCIPEHYLDIPHVDRVSFGWAGQTQSHPFDLQVIGPAAARLIREGFDYLGTGSDVGLRQALGADYDVETSGDTTVEEWPHRIAEMGVGIAPLADTVFNAAKSHLKILEYMSLGLPWVASPRAEYLRLHRLTKVGLMAKTPADWYRKLRYMLTDELLRLDQSAAGREAAASLTIEGNAWRWLEAWERAYNLQHQQSLVG